MEWPDAVSPGPVRRGWLVPFSPVMAWTGPARTGEAGAAWTGKEALGRECRGSHGFERMVRRHCDRASLPAIVTRGL